MFDLKLFLGFQTDETFSKELLQTNPYMISLFVGKEDYLQEIHLEGKRYLGKHLSSFPTLDQLEDVEKHIVSLLKQLAPRYVFAKNPPYLLTLNGT